METASKKVKGWFKREKKHDHSLKASGDTSCNVQEKKQVGGR